MRHEQGDLDVNENRKLADMGVQIGAIVICVIAVAFSLAPVWI